MLTNRQKKLLTILNKERNYIKIDDLAKQLGVSNRTIYSELKYLSVNGYQTISKREEGIRLVNEYVPSQLPLNTMDIPTNIRRIEIIKKLLFENENITLKELSEKYFVSQTSIKNDLKFIEQVLFQNGPSFIISNNKGTKISKMKMEQKIIVFLNFNRFIIQFHSYSGDNFIESSSEILSKYYSKDIISVCKNILYTFIRHNVMSVLDMYIDSLLNIYIILVSELLNGHHFDKIITPLNKTQHAFYISSAVNLLHKASLRLNFKYTNGDIEYLSQMLLNYRFEPIPLENREDEFIETLLINVSQAMNLNFLKDKHLKEQLYQHIPAMIYRLKYGTHIQNPFKDQIKLEFSITYNILWLILQELGQEVGVTFNEDEVSYLTIYFQLSIEKISKNRKILIVCQTGIVTSELLINRIKKLVPSLDQVEIASINEMYEKDLSQFDLILSTVETNIRSSNIYFVSPFIKNEEILKILNKKPVEDSINLDIATYKDNNYFYSLINQNFTTKTELLSTVGTFLIDKGFVMKEFISSIFEREKMGSTEFPLGVALPHGKSEFVLKTVVVFIQNNHKIKWKKSLVDTVFLIAISKNDLSNAKSIISNINSIISDSSRLKILKQTKNILKVNQILNNQK